MKQETENLKYCNDTIEIKEDIETSYIDLAEHLYNIKEHNIFMGQWESFEEFSMELKMSSNMVNKLMQMYKLLILGFGMTHKQILTAGGWSSIQEVLPVITDKKTAIKWLQNAGTLTRSDLRKMLRELKTGIDMTKCKHPDTYLIRICKTCGDKHQVFEK